MVSKSKIGMNIRTLSAHGSTAFSLPLDINHINLIAGFLFTHFHSPPFFYSVCGPSLGREKREWWKSWQPFSRTLDPCLREIFGPMFLDDDSLGETDVSVYWVWKIFFRGRVTGVIVKLNWNRMSTNSRSFALPESKNPEEIGNI